MEVPVSVSFCFGRIASLFDERSNRELALSEDLKQWDYVIVWIMIHFIDSDSYVYRDLTAAGISDKKEMAEFMLAAYQRYIRKKLGISPGE